MAEPISIQQLKDASEDAISLADFINEPENVMIPRRLASDINSLQYYLEYMKSYSQRSYETYDEMAANASNLSENVSVFVTNDSDTSKNGIYTYNGESFVKGEYQPENAAKDFVEAKLGGLQVFDGKVRAQDVSTDDGSTQEVKNTEFRSELDALPFVDGILPDTLVSIGSGLTQKDFNFGVHDVATLLALLAPIDGMVVNTASYLAGEKVGGNTYRYNSARDAENDGGSILNGWEVVGKTEFTPEDFGALPSVETLDNDAALRKFISSGLNLVVPDNTTYSFSTINSFNINKPLFLKGGGMYSSIIKRLSLYFETDDSKVTDVGLHTLVPQYTCYIRKGSRNVFTRVYTYHNYDGFALYRKAGLPASEKLSGNQFIDCVSEKSGRVGFTVDIGAYETLVEGCRAIDCRQGFHIEGAETTWIKRGVSERCGLLAAFDTGENVGYEGSLRSYGVNGLYVDDFENINPNGRCQWQHGGGNHTSSNLNFNNLKGVGSLILDDSIETTTDMHFSNIKSGFAIFRPAYKQIINGKVSFVDVHGSGGVMLGGDYDLSISDCSFGTVAISCNNLYMHNVKLTTNTAHSIRAESIISTGILENIQTVYQETLGGLVFDMAKCVYASFNNIKFSGGVSGFQFGMTNLSIATTKSINLGDVIFNTSMATSINGGLAYTIDYYKWGIRYNTSVRTFRTNAIPTVGSFVVGDMVYKTTITADTIYGWVCTTAGIDAAAVWKPLKYSV